ncbi:type II secretion system protein J [Paenibacillus nicotianae]|uniref:Type II secretion system protein J n=1 Tax=Paenibacillus nicotianae TaxID=1526551 RepID=A0ABW4UZC5_9BACL
MRKFVDRLRRQEGFTLVEMLPTLLLLAMVMSMIYGVAHFGMRSYNQIKVENSLRDEGDILMSSIITELYTFAPDRVRQLTVNGKNIGIRLERDPAIASGTTGTIEVLNIYMQAGSLYIGSLQSVSSSSTVTSIVQPKDQVRAIQSQLGDNSSIQIQSDGRTVYTSGIIQIKLALSQTVQGQSKSLVLESNFGF